MSSEHFPVQERLQEQIAVNNASWEEFEARVPNMITLSNVPFPSEEMLHCVGDVDSSLRDQWFKSLARRWHPDRFQNRFGSRMDHDDKEQIIAKVTEVFCLLTSARG